MKRLRLGLIMLLVANLFVAGMTIASAHSQGFARSRIVQEAPFLVEIFWEEGSREFAEAVIKYINPADGEKFVVTGIQGTPSSPEGVAFHFPGTEPKHWTPSQEEQGVAWIFRSDKPIKLVVPWGTLDTDRGKLRAGDEHTTMGATWRPRNPNFKPEAAAQPQPAAAPPFPTPPPQITDTCMLGKDLAAKMGWKVVSLPDSVTKYGGAVVEVPVGASLPAKWEYVGNGRAFSQGGTFSIYPPPGGCRTRLGVQG